MLPDKQTNYLLKIAQMCIQDVTDFASEVRYTSR